MSYLFKKVYLHEQLTCRPYIFFLYLVGQGYTTGTRP